MTPEEVVKAADVRITELQGIPDVSAGNYKQELAEYRRLLSDMLVMIRELAKEVSHLSPSSAST